MPVAVVTGANKGIGFAVVRALCQKYDGDVILTSRDESKGRKAIEELQTEDLNPKYHVLDICQEESVVKFREFIKSSYKGIDVLVNNAGIAVPADINNLFDESSSPDVSSFINDFKKTLATNYWANKRACDILFPILNPGARVVNMTSSVGFLGTLDTYTRNEVETEKIKKILSSPDLTEETLEDLIRKCEAAAEDGLHVDQGWPNCAYAVSKIALSALTRIQQQMMDSDPRNDIVINHVHPGLVDTDMTSYFENPNKLTVDRYKGPGVRMDTRYKPGMVLLAGNSHPGLAEEIAKHLGTGVGSCLVYHNTNRETMVDIQESVRGKDVYIIQTAARNVNDIIMELLIMAYACKTSNCKNIVGILPCLPYSQQTKMKRRGNISLKLIADMCVKSGFDHLLTVDLHSKESQGFFGCRMDNLRAAPFFLQYVIENIPDYQNAVIVARNPLGARRATSFADRLKVNIAVLHGEYKDEADERDDDDGRASPPPQVDQPAADRTRIFNIGPPLPPGIEKEKPALYLVGDVAGKIAIMVDDIMDDVHSFVKAAQVLKDNGASMVYCMATHGILSKEAPVLIQQSCIDEVVVTNSVPHDTQKARTNKIKTVDISILLAEAIRRIHNKESMSHLFRNVTMED